MRWYYFYWISIEQLHIRAQGFPQHHTPDGHQCLRSSLTDNRDKRPNKFWVLYVIDSRRALA